MKRLLAALAVAIVGTLPALAGPTAATAAPSAHASIVGGRAASIAEFPSLVYIEFSEATGTYSCTGSVVAPKVVLTAGHCVENVESAALTPASGYAIATGISNVSKATPANVSRVAQTVIYPGFRPSHLTGDAGLLILPAPVAAPVLPLASALDAPLLAAGTSLSIAGWGLTDPSSPEGPNTLHAGTTAVQSASYCQRQTKGYYPFYSATAQLCAVDKSARSARGCYGDSGGPAIAHRADGTAVEVGVASSVKPGCIASFPTVFTRVDQIGPWVASWIAAVEAGGPTPAIEVPKAHLPPLFSDRAEELAELVLEKHFGSNFTKPSFKRISCFSTAKATAHCRIAWTKGAKAYFGAMTIFYVLRSNVVEVRDHYTIREASRSCLVNSANPNRCPTQTKRH